MEDLDRIVQEKIAAYKPGGNLDHTARLILALSAVNHDRVQGHLERVALLAEAVASKFGKDAKAAFFAGLLHDFGKLILPPDLFCGREITEQEYELVKTHARAGFEVLRQFHEFIAVCAGCHHAMYKRGYGLTMEDFPSDWSPATVKKVLEISAIVSICDFVDAYKTRKTTLRDSSIGTEKNLWEMLSEKYPEELLVIEAALEVAKGIYGNE